MLTMVKFLSCSASSREYKSAISNAIIDGWNKFTSEIDNPSDVSKLIRTFNNSNNNALGLLKNDQGDYCNNPEESLSILLQQFFPGHTDVPEVDTMVWSMVRNNKLDNTFTIKKIKNAFQMMGSFKGAGPDGLKPIVMKNFGPIALRCISFIFKAIYSTGYIPLELRKSRVVFIPKPLKTDYGEAGSLDPSLSPNIILRPWNESLSGPSGRTPTSMAKYHKCNMHTAPPKVLILHYQPV